MSKRELIERIIQLNQTARREFLLQFNESELGEYLRALESIQQPRGSSIARCATAQ